MMITIYIWALIIGACWSKMEESGKQECIGNLCENMVYEIKDDERTLCLAGSRYQCNPGLNKFLLKFLVPSDVQWLKIGTPITIFRPSCGPFMTIGRVRNVLVITRYVCSSTNFFLFHELPGQNECVSVFYVREDTLFAIRRNALKFVAFKNSSTIGQGWPANITLEWCLNALLEQEVGGTKTANHLMPECKYYQHQTGYSGNRTCDASPTKNAPEFVENQMSTKSSSQTTGEPERKRQQCLAKRIM